MFKKFSLFFSVSCGVLLLTSCELSYKVPKLPDLNQKTFSYKEIFQKKQELRRRVQKHKNVRVSTEST